MAATAHPLRAPRRIRPRGRTLVQGMAAVFALLVAAGGAVALVAPALGRAPMASTGQAGPAVALLVLLAGAGLVATGAFAWFARPDRTLSLIAFLAGAAWLGLELRGSASVMPEARTLGVVIAPMFAPLIVHLPVRALGADRLGSPVALLLGLLYAATAIASAGHALTYDPFFDVHCAPVCTRGDNVLVLVQDARLASAFEDVALGVAVGGSVGLAAWALGRLVRARPTAAAEGGVALAAVTVGIGLSWWSGTRIATDPDLPTQSPLLEPALATVLSLIAISVAVIGLVASRIRRAEALRRLADAITAGAGSPSLRVTLSRTLGDARVRVGYPVEGGGMIDETGTSLDDALPGTGRAVTAIERGGTLIALVEHDPDLDPELLAREIGAAARLAVDNERLEATIRARLRELRASRARIVEAADLARGRLERDLHDGAQQRLLAVSFQLRLAVSAIAQAVGTSDALAELERDVEEVDRALGELRDLAHGIHPVVLFEDGLTGALASLTEEASLPVEVTGQVGRCPATTELAAYLAVVEAVRRASGARAERLEVTIEAREDELRLELAWQGLSEGPWVRIEDRVGAAGGEVFVRTSSSGSGTVGIVLPCG